MKGLVRILLPLALLLAGGGPLPAQQDWTWAFGDSVRMHFPGGGTPVVDPAGRGRYTLETATCLSDSLGALRYFVTTDHIVQPDNVVMPSASPLPISCGEGANSAITFPVWGGGGLSMVFNASQSCSGGMYRCPRFTLVGKGTQGRDSVVRHYALGQYHPLNGIVEKVAAVRDAQGTGWWVLMHGDEDDKFLVWKVDGARVSPFTLQTIGSVHTIVGLNPYAQIGEICFSPQGDRLALATFTGLVEVFDFDRCTGTLSNWRALGSPGTTVPGPNTFYGCSFSPDGSKLYVSENYQLTAPNRLFQWDLDAADVPLSKTLVASFPDTVEVGQHQLGPDGRIYITALHPLDSSSSANYHLSVINDPDQAGAACNFVYNGLWLQGRRSTLSLPNLPNFNLPPLVAQVAEAGPPRVVCPGDSVRIGYPDSTGGAVAYRWRPGAGVSDSTAAWTWARPAASGWYHLEALDTAMGAPCGLSIDSVFVQVADSTDYPVVDALGDTSLCAGDTTALRAVAQDPAWTYTWTPSAGLSAPDSAWTLAWLPGTYTLEARNPLGAGACLVARDAVQVAVDPSLAPPAGLSGRDTVLCIGDSLWLGGPAPPGWTWSWSPAAGLSDPSAPGTWSRPASTALYILAGVDSLTGGNCRSWRDSALVEVERPFEQEPPQDVVFCPGEAVAVGVPPVEGRTYCWTPPSWVRDPAAATALFAPPGGMAYVLHVTDTALRSVRCRERGFPVALIDGGCAPQNVLTPNGDGINDLFDLGPSVQAPVLEVFDRWGARVYFNAAYRNDWDAAGLPDGVYWYTAQAQGRRWVGELTVLR